MDSKRNLVRKESLLVAHPELHIRKSKIFSENDPKLRKTKIICTIGYNILNFHKK
jgi:hypothetical protein